MEFDRIIARDWTGETMAVSEKKARCNLAFQFKLESGRAPRSKISLPGEIYMIEMEGWEIDERV